jgi:putative sigma-54 modulation protein
MIEMKLDLTGLHIEVTSAIEDFVTKKIEKLGKFFDDSTICHVTFSAKKEKQHVDIRIEYKGHTYISREDSQDLYYAVESCVEKIEAQYRKQKSVIEKKRREGVSEEVISNLTLDEILKEKE